MLIIEAFPHVLATAFFGILIDVSIEIGYLHDDL